MLPRCCPSHDVFAVWSSLGLTEAVPLCRHSGTGLPVRRPINNAQLWNRARPCRRAGTGTIGSPQRFEVSAVVPLPRLVLWPPWRRWPDRTRLNLKPILEDARDFGLRDLVRSLVSALATPFVPTGALHGVERRDDLFQLHAVLPHAGIERVAQSRQQNDYNILVVIALGEDDRSLARQCAPSAPVSVGDADERAPNLGRAAMQFLR